MPFLPFNLGSRIALPFARRKSLAGFIAASITAGAIVFGFWGWIAPMANRETSWTWDHKILGGWAGLSFLSVVSALVGGVAEALGMFFDKQKMGQDSENDLCYSLDLGSLDDNLTLPIISGGTIWGFIRVVSALF
jgi:diacylglycerol kinase (CTP)